MSRYRTSAGDRAPEVVALADGDEVGIGLAVEEIVGDGVGVGLGASVGVAVEVGVGCEVGFMVPAQPRSRTAAVSPTRALIKAETVAVHQGFRSAWLRRTARRGGPFGSSTPVSAEAGSPG